MNWCQNVCIIFAGFFMDFDAHNLLHPAPGSGSRRLLSYPWTLSPTSGSLGIAHLSVIISDRTQCHGTGVGDPFYFLERSLAPAGRAANHRDMRPKLFWPANSNKS